jgi:hypothetical protein
MSLSDDLRDARTGRELQALRNEWSIEQVRAAARGLSPLELAAAKLARAFRNDSWKPVHSSTDSQIFEANTLNGIGDPDDSRAADGSTTEGTD